MRIAAAHIVIVDRCGKTADADPAFVAFSGNFFFFFFLFKQSQFIVFPFGISSSEAIGEAALLPGFSFVSFWAISEFFSSEAGVMKLGFSEPAFSFSAFHFWRLFGLFLLKFLNSSQNFQRLRLISAEVCELFDDFSSVSEGFSATEVFPSAEEKRMTVVF